MKISFGKKFSLLMLLAMTSLVGSMLICFYQYSNTTMKKDLQEKILDVTRTGAFVFNEEDRALIEEFRDHIYTLLPADYRERIDHYVNKKGKGELLDSDVYEKLQNELDFHYLVQLLRRIQDGSKDQVDKLAILPQEKIHEAGSSKIAWTYLLVKIPEIPVEKSMMFLALSFYLADGHYAATPISTLYTPDEASLMAIKGKVGLSNDWYVGAESGDTVMSAVIPLKNEQGEVIAALGVDYLVGNFRERIANQKFISVIVFAITVVIALVLTFFITAWISIPLSKLRIGAEQLSKRDFEHRVDIKSNDEFGLLADTFNKVSDELGIFTQDLDSIVKAKTARLSQAREEVIALNNILNQENAHLGAEVKNIIALRERTLPYLNQKIKLDNYEVSFNYLPSQAVCGDFWQVRNDNECTDISFGFLSGYGLETAMMAMQIQSLFKVSDGNNSERLSAINSFLFAQEESINLKLLCKLLSLQINEDNIRLSGSGEAPIRFSANHQEFIKLAGSLPLGVNRDITMESVVLHLHTDEGLLLYSAGFKRALAHFGKLESDALQAQDIIHLSGLLGDSNEHVMDKLAVQPWFDDFNQDISFILISRKGS